MSDFKWTNVTGDMKIVDLFKKREEIEEQIRELDEMALVRYECERLALPQANGATTGEKQCDLPVVMPRYVCKPENITDVLFYLDSSIKELQKNTEDTTPEEWTLKDIYDQLNAFNGA